MLTVSDGVVAGSRSDTAGPALAERLAALDFEVRRAAVPDEPRAIEDAVRGALDAVALVVVTGGTGLGPRDVTPQVLHGLLDYQIPGFGEAMRADGRRSTPFAILSRSLAGVAGRTLVIAVPGSEGAALESLEALAPVLDHALETIAGDTAHHPPGASNP